MIKFSVYGIPKPQGSVRAFKNIIVQGGSKEGRIALASWRTICVDACRAALVSRAGQGFPDGAPIGLRLTWYLPRPKSLPKHVLHPTKKPDIDKLERAAMDAFSTILYSDDSNVVVTYKKKVFATADRTPGLDVEAWML